MMMTHWLPMSAEDVSILCEYFDELYANVYDTIDEDSKKICDTMEEIFNMYRRRESNELSNV